MKNLTWLEDKPEDARNFLQNLVQHSSANKSKNEIKTLYLFLTRKCNLGCSHCYIEGVGATARDNDFNFEKIKSIVDQALKLGLRKVKISGGEPFIHQEILTILAFFNSLNLDEIVLETNGTLISDIAFKELKKIGNLTVYVSLDHSVAEKHDEFRNKSGAFDKTVAFLKKLGNSQINSVVTTTASKSNYKHILDIIAFAINIGIKKHRTLLNIHPLGNALQNMGNELSLTECLDIIETIVNSDFYKQHKAYLTLPPALTPINDLKNISTCGWGDQVLGILSTGEVSMCSASYEDSEMIAGDLNRSSLKDIWENSFFSDLREIQNGNVKGVCGNCVLYKLCKGVCKMSSYSHYGEKDAPYPLCQEFYNKGLFPNYALIDPEKDCYYTHSKLIKTNGNFPHKAFINQLINSV